MMQPLLNLAHGLRRILLRLAGRRTRGVRVMVFDPDGRLLLVRHSYGARDQWMLPGGGIDRRETEAEAAIREVREEAGCRVRSLERLGAFDASRRRRDGAGQQPKDWRDAVFLFAAITADSPVADGREITDARFWPLDALPPSTSPATRRRVGEWQTGRYSELW